jgi:CRISPR type III-B/RAMP module-associated protein Cmr3
MSDHSYNLQPRDQLFLRDARPMAASDAGLGANWPRPDQLWNAIINAFHRQWPDRQPWEGAEHTKRATDKHQESSFRFGALQTLGPFPSKDGEIYFPCPLDWNMELVLCDGTDLPKPLKHAFRAKKPGKEDRPTWISATDYTRYLAGESFEPTKPELYDEERTIGIAINPETRTTGDDDHKLYQAEYLRLRPNVSLAFAASCNIKPKGGACAMVDVFARADAPQELILGGQQGVAGLTTQKAELRLPQAKITTQYLRWTLLSPAVFTAGWLPGWCRDSRKIPDADKQPLGTVMLKNVSATLIAARIGKPLPFSGWDLQTGPKPTQLAVPAGSAYVFDCGTVQAAQALACMLTYPSRRSDSFGEKGFGLGVCSSVNL